MDYEEFKPIVMGNGYTELEAKWLWSAKPEGQEATVMGVNLASEFMLPLILKVREKPDHKDIMRQHIAMANAVNN